MSTPPMVDLIQERNRIKIALREVSTVCTVCRDIKVRDGLYPLAPAF